MGNCDVCGDVLGEHSQNVQLYSARLIKREYSRAEMGSRKTSVKYDHFKPVLIQACGKHQRELRKQQILPGVIVFILIIIPVLFLLKFVPFVGSSVYIQVPAALVLTSLATVKIIQALVRYDNYLALLLTIKEKRSGSDLEYLTKNKYQRYSGNKIQQNGK